MTKKKNLIHIKNLKQALFGFYKVSRKASSPVLSSAIVNLMLRWSSWCDGKNFPNAYV